MASVVVGWDGSVNGNRTPHEADGALITNGVAVGVGAAVGVGELLVGVAVAGMVSAGMVGVFLTTVAESSTGNGLVIVAAGWQATGKNNKRSSKPGKQRVIHQA